MSYGRVINSWFNNYLFGVHVKSMSGLDGFHYSSDPSFNNGEDHRMNSQEAMLIKASAHIDLIIEIVACV